METGEPYVMYKDNVNKDNPIAYRLKKGEGTRTKRWSEMTVGTE